MSRFKLVEAFSSFISRIPAADSERLRKHWSGVAEQSFDGQGEVVLNGTPVFLVVEDAPWFGLCSPDGKTICFSRVVMSWHRRGMELLLAHECAHALQAAYGNLWGDKATVEREARLIMARWGYRDYEIEFWHSHSMMPKHIQREMLSQLQGRYGNVARILDEWRAEAAA